MEASARKPVRDQQRNLGPMASPDELMDAAAPLSDDVVGGPGLGTGTGAGPTTTLGGDDKEDDGGAFGVIVEARGMVMMRSGQELTAPIKGFK